MTVQKKRVVALLDVDDTLIFGASPNIEYNNALIDTLLENDVKDVYLFSSMSLKKNIIEERKELIKYLESQGLTVHGVICASDLVWHKDKKLLQELYQKACEIKDNKELLELFKKDTFKPLTHFDDAIPGEAFATTARDRTDNFSRENAELYNNTASIIMRYLNHNNTSVYNKHVAETEKSYLYQMFAKNKPKWAGAVIFVDDQDKNINAVKGMHSQLTPKYRLLTLLNRGENRAVQNETSFYQNIIQPFVEMALALFNAFNSYKLGRKLTHSKAKNEILAGLELALETCETSEEVNQVKANFHDAYQKLNHHRFSFWSDAKTRSATVFDHMFKKREEQLKASTGLDYS